MAHILTVFAREGGAGKSFISGNLAAEIANDGSKVLLVVCDPQNDNADRYLVDVLTGEQDNGYDTMEHRSVADVLFHDMPYEDAVYRSLPYRKSEYRRLPDGTLRRFVSRKDVFQFDIIPSSSELSHYSIQDVRDNQELYGLMAEKFSDAVNRYDYIIIDTPPSDSAVCVMALAFSDHVIIPVTSDDKSVNSLQLISSLVQELGMVGYPTHILGMVFNKYMKNSPRDVSFDESYAEYSDVSHIHFFKTHLPQSTVIGNASYFHTPLCSLTKCSLGPDKAMRAFTDEVYQLLADGATRA